MNKAESPRKVKVLRALVRLFDEAVNLAVLVSLLALLLIGGYSLWDSKQLSSGASVQQFNQYKPTVDDSLSFEELQELNSDVFGWLTIYGTGIDYPLVHGEDNWVYLNYAPDGSYSLSGSIFLDSRSSPDMSDYLSIIHGHHMADGVMFGDLSKFENREFFDTHRYGNLFCNGRDYGLVFFEYSLVDAYDGKVYNPMVENDEGETLAYIESLAVYLRDEKQAEAENIILFSTCASESTNGRYLLAAIRTDETYEDEFYVEPVIPVHQTYSLDRLVETTETVPLWAMLAALLVILIAVYVILDHRIKKKRRERFSKVEEKEG